MKTRKRSLYTIESGWLQLNQVTSKDILNKLHSLIDFRDVLADRFYESGSDSDFHAYLAVLAQINVLRSLLGLPEIA